MYQGIISILLILSFPLYHSGFDLNDFQSAKVIAPHGNLCIHWQNGSEVFFPDLDKINEKFLNKGVYSLLSFNLEFCNNFCSVWQK